MSLRKAEVAVVTYSKLLVCLLDIMKKQKATFGKAATIRVLGVLCVNQSQVQFVGSFPICSLFRRPSCCHTEYLAAL